MKSINHILVASLIILNGCVNIKQFIDVDDMLTIKADFTKDQVYNSIGKPSMVRAGLKLKSGDIYEVWVYNVKKSLTKQVFDYNRLLPAFILPGMKPKKDFKGNGWSGNKLYGFMFINDKLFKWGFLGDDWPNFDKVDGDFLAPGVPKGGAGGNNSSSTNLGGSFLSKIPIIGKLF